MVLIFTDGGHGVVRQGTDIFAAVLFHKLGPGFFDKLRLIHGLYKGKGHNLGGFQHTLHAHAGAGEGGVLPGVIHIAKAGGAFSVDRGAGDVGAIEHADTIIKRGHIVGIFPEGTRYKTGAPRKAKSGIAYIAMHTKADILPVSIYREGEFNIFRKTTVRCGKVIPFNEIYDETLSDRANLKNIVNRVTDELTALWEMGHEN